MESSVWRMLADAILMLHLGVVLFVVAGFVWIVVGNLRRWPGVNGWWFRSAHLAAIAIVVLEAWLGATCPLTTLEDWLRAQAGEAGYSHGFVEYWVRRVLFYDAPPWVFTLGYTLFGVLVAAAWWRFPPGRGGRPGNR